MRKRHSRTIDLQNELSKMLKVGRLDHALEIYELIEKRKPDEARWPHRKGELLNRLGRIDEAVVAYERAVDLYAAKGFVERAAATAKVMLKIDPSRTDVLQRLQQEAADSFHHALFDTSDAHVHHRR